jgi:diguanylate cyclase (GGDEF)-like protein
MVEMKQLSAGKSAPSRIGYVEGVSAGRPGDGAEKETRSVSHTQANASTNVRTRLLLPTALFAIVLLTVISLLTIDAQTTFLERQRLYTSQHEDTVQAVFTARLEQTQEYVDALRRSNLIAAAVSARARGRIADVLSAYPRRSITAIALYANGARIYADDRSGKARDAFASFDALAQRMSIDRGEVSGFFPAGSGVMLVSAAPIRTANGTLGTIVAGLQIDDGFLRGIAAASGVDLAFYYRGKVVATSLANGKAPIPADFRQTALAPDRGLIDGRRASIVLLEDDSIAQAEARRSLLFIIGAIALAGIFAIGMSMNAIRSVTRSERRLRFDAMHDALTGLANRRFFNDALQVAVDDFLINPERRYAILYIDLDHFKFVNDSLGHEIGDRVLMTVAERIKRITRPRDVVARLGGDEFAVLLTDVQQETAMAILERVQHDLAAPVTLDSRTIFTTASIGITFGSKAYKRGEDLLRDADAALYRAKAQGRAQHVVFDKEMLLSARRRLQIDTELRLAYERNHLRLKYQPIYDFKLGRYEGWEALLRWTHPQLGEIAPSVFIPIAEETGLILGIGNWVIHEACRQLAEWKTRFPAMPQTMAINLSAQQMIQPQFDKQIAAILGEHGLRGSDLCLEITESVILDGTRLEPTRIEALKAIGCKLHIDDFGTGYSSLTYLQRHPVDAIKIDRSFVGGDGDDLTSPQIVSTLITLAESLGLYVVAEGIETRAQFDSLAQMQCRYGQGYMIAHPLDPDQAAELLTIAGMPI